MHAVEEDKVVKTGRDNDDDDDDDDSIYINLSKIYTLSSFRELFE